MHKSDIVPPPMSVAKVNAQNSSEVPLNRNQIRGFWAAWGGWALDGMDSFIYALVLVPSLRDLLPRSGIPATKGEIGFYGGLLFALFLIGWGLAVLWGPIGDKFGRVHTLMITVVWYSVFTFLSALVTNVGQLAILRLLAGIGIGGEWAMGGTFVAEEWPENRRRAGAGYMHTGYYVGIFLAAMANYIVGTHYGHNGWQGRLAVGRPPSGAMARLGPARGDGAGAVAAESCGRSNMAGLAAIRSAFFKGMATQDHSEFAFDAVFHQRALGGNGLCARGCYRTRGGCRTHRSASGPTCFARNHARGVRDDSRMFGHAVACGKARKARSIGVLFH